MNDFTDRLQEVIKHYKLTASSFANSIGIQRSSISHLLSGRNKPSLDFVMKVLENYNEVELDWFVNGKGIFPKKVKDLRYPTDLFDNKDVNKPEEIISKDIPVINEEESPSGIDKIIIFYKNGTFKKYTEL